MRIKFRPFFVNKRLGLCDECARKLLIVSFPEETAIIKGFKLK